MASAPFLPTSIPNCIIWLDPSDLSTVQLSGTTISSVTDKSATAANFNQGTTKPTNTNPINGLTTMNFQGGSLNILGALNTTAYNNITQFSMFVVNRPTYTSGSIAYAPCMFAIRSTTTTTISWHIQPNYSNTTGFNGSTTTNSGTLIAQNELNLFEIVQGASSYTSYKNGNAGTTVSYTITAQTGLPASVGNSAVGNGEGFQGQIAEVIFFSRTLSNTERQQIEGYLAWKWGLQTSLPASHPYRSFPPTGTYYLSTTQVILTNTNVYPGTLRLPSSFELPGRVLVYKDQYGALSTNSLTITTNNPNQTIDSTITSTINTTALGWQTFIAGNNNNWYTVGGTFINMINASTVNTTVYNSRNISTANVFTSTLGLQDQSFGSTNRLYVQSTFLYYSFSNTSTIISGTRQSFGGLFTPIRRLFLPNQITSLQLWLDGANSNTIVNPPNVIRWIDSSITNKRVVLGSGSVAPVYVGNGLNFIDTNALLVVTSMPTTPYDILIVGSPQTNNAGYRTFLRTEASPGVHPILTNSGTNNVGMWNGASFQQFGTYTWTGNERALFYVKATTTTAVVCEASKNGDINLTAPTTPNTTDSIITRVGNSGIGQAAGIINEVVIYNATLTTAQRQQVEGYLAWKWNLVSALPASHPYKNSPP